MPAKAEHAPAGAPRRAAKRGAGMAAFAAFVMLTALCGILYGVDLETFGFVSLLLAIGSLSMLILIANPSEKLALPYFLTMTCLGAACFVTGYYLLATAF